MAQAPLDPSDVLAVQETYANNYASVAFLMVLLYDIAITFGDEVEFIWKQPGLGLGKVLFFLNRYIPPLDLVILINTYVNPEIDPKICVPFFKVDNWLSVFSLAVVDIILLLRTWALWNRSTKVLVSLVSVFILCTLATSGAIVYLTLAVFPTPSLGPRVCEEAFKQLNVVEAVWGSTILFDTSILIFTLIRIVPHFKLNTTTALIEMIYRDGFLYFGVMFIISLANLFVFALAPVSLKLTLVTLQRVMFSLLGSRIVLNLHGVLTRRSIGTGAGDTNAELSTFRANDPSRDGGTTTLGGSRVRDSPSSPHSRKSRIPSYAPRRRPHPRGYGQEFDEDSSLGKIELGSDDEDSPQDDSPATPWSPPWNPFRAGKEDEKEEKSSQLEAGEFDHEAAALADVVIAQPEPVDVGDKIPGSAL